jgi:CheY-like chemotaxis protein
MNAQGKVIIIPLNHLFKGVTAMKKQKILIIDDELDMRTFLSTLFETSGYKPLIAADGLEGLQKAKENRPGLILLDVMMPKEGGIQMYRELKMDDSLRDIPVIMLSGIARKTFFHSQRILDLHVGRSVPEPEAYIEKPPEPDELLAITEKILRAKRGNLPSV